MHIESEERAGQNPRQARFSFHSLLVYSRKVPDLMSSSNAKPPTDKLAQLEQRTDSLDKRLTQMDEKLLPIAWKHVAWISGALVALVGIGVGFYVHDHVPTQINAAVAPLSTKVGELERQPSNKQLEELKSVIESVNKSLSAKIDENDKRINQRLDDFLSAIARDASRVNRSYAHSVSAKGATLKQTLPVAQELLVRARKEGTVLPYRDLNGLARLTLPLLDRKYQDQTIRQEVWNTAWELASYKSFVDGKFFSSRILDNDCNEGRLDFGGIKLENKVYANCELHYRGGDIIFSNVRLLNVKFEMADQPQAKMFLSKFLLNKGGAVSIDTSSKETGSE
jgi:hypothetical protein